MSWNLATDRAGPSRRCAVRGLQALTSPGRRAEWMSACAVTRYVRPRMLKSLTYTEPI